VCGDDFHVVRRDDGGRGGVCLLSVAAVVCQISVPNQCPLSLSRDGVVEVRGALRGCVSLCVYIFMHAQTHTDG
jgi:hypothetical protein